jgi:hypothetical protein
MSDISVPVPGNPATAGRAIGAMFFSVFGGAWLGLWANAQFPGAPALLIIAVCTAALLATAYRLYRANAPAMKAHSQTAVGQRISRQFNLINALQWIVIVGCAMILSRTGHDRWILPMVILVIGLHFLPLARLFQVRAHYLTGIALVLLAAIYPFTAPDGPADAVGALGAGLILWASAGWAVLSARRAP